MEWSELRQDVRDRVGEPTDADGTWTQAELLRYANRAFPRITQECVLPASAEFPEPLALLMDEHEIYTKEGIYEYALPANFQRALYVVHRRGESTQWRRMTNRSRASLLSGFLPSERSDTPLWYDITLNKLGKPVAWGVASGGGATTLVDSARAVAGFATASAFDDGTAVKDDGANALAAGDLVYNLSDQSVATITALTDNETITFSGGLGGGARGTFRLGDRYLVEAVERSRAELMIYPPPSSGLRNHTDVVDITGTASTSLALVIGNNAGTETKAAMSFTLNYAATISGFTLSLGANTGSPVGAITVSIEDVSASAPGGALQAVLAKGAIESPTENAVNFVPLEGKINLAAGTYAVVAETIAQATDSNYYTWKAGSSLYSGGNAAIYTPSSWAAQATTDALMTVHQADELERIYLCYVPKPVTLVNDTDVIEFPHLGLEAVMADIEERCYAKIGDFPRRNDAKQRVEFEVQKIKDDLREGKFSPNARIGNRLVRVNLRPRYGRPQVVRNWRNVVVTDPD